MRHAFWCCCYCWLAIIVLAGALPVAAAQPMSQPSEDAASDAPAQLSTMLQTVRHFDFEHDGSSSNAMPIPFYRYVSPSEGFTPFGTMRLTTDAPAAGGQGTFEFKLGGGSMSARLPRSVIPVLPMASYVVSAKVRTEGLSHARARLIAWLHDAAGQPIAESRIESRAVQTNGRWETLSVEIDGRFANAADLVLELQVAQPGMLMAADQRQGNVSAPQIEDITGSVWFDDVIVAHLPHISITLDNPGNVVLAPEAPTLQIMVNEVTGSAMSARVRVFDLNGQSVFDTTLPAPRGHHKFALPIPVSGCGWYRAVLDVYSRSGLSHQRQLDFVVIPSTHRRSHLPPADRFGLALDPDPHATIDMIAAMVSHLHGGHASIPIWSQGSADSAVSPRQHQLIERLLRQQIELLLSLEAVPSDLARGLNLHTDQVLELLSHDARLWRSHLDELLVAFGLETRRWKIGAIDGIEAFWRNDLSDTIAAATKSLADFVPEPILYANWTAELEPPATPPPGLSIVVPYHIRPDEIQHYAASWLEHDVELTAIMESPPDEIMSPRQQVVDLMLRTLHSWRAGIPVMMTQTPWRRNSMQPSQLMPRPIFGPWRTLAAQLNDRTFVGTLPIGENVTCWILAGPTLHDAALVAWCDPPLTGSAQQFRSQLAIGAVEVIDAFGNVSTVAPRNDEHTITLSDMPVFIQNIDLELVQFRGGMRIDPPFVPAVFKVHEHEIVLRNPWSVAVSGTLHLHQDDQWQLSPTTQEFAIAAHGETRLPLNIVPQRSIIAGRRSVQADITLVANRTYSMRIESEIEVGLKNIELAASWTVVENPRTGETDLVLTQAVTNRGQQPMNLELYVLAPGISQHRRVIPGLPAGDTAVRSFRIPGGAAILAGKQVRVGVSERDGNTRLNRLLTITPMNASPAHAAASTE